MPLERRSLNLVVFLLTLSVSYAIAGEPPQTAAKETPEADYSQQAVVVEKLASTIRFEADGTSTRDEHTRIRIQTEAAVQQLGQLVLNYNSESERFVFKGKVIKPDHTEVEITESAIQDLSSPVSRIAPMYTDTRQKHVTVPALRPGDTLEYETHVDQFKPLAPNQFWTRYNFTKRAIVLSEELTIDVPAAKYSNVKTREDLPKPEIKEAKGRRIFRWKSANLTVDDDSKANREKKKKAKRDDIADVRVTTFKTWEEIAEWYAGLERDRRVPNEAIRAKTAELTKGLTTDLEKLEAIYNYVAKDYRYVSLSFGAGRYQPHAATEILGNQYGDCKDKNTLLEAMAEAVGIHVDAVLISSQGKVDPDFPSPAQFDHVISYVPLGNDVVWLDTTTELAPFRMLMLPLRKKKALVVTGDSKAGLRDTPTESGVANYEGVEVTGNINELGTLTADARFTWRGDVELAGRLKARQIPTAKLDEFGKRLVKLAGVDGDVTNVQISDVNDTQHALEYSLHLVKPNYYNRFEKNDRLEIPMANLHVPDLADTEEGKPFDIPKTTFEYKLKLELPKSFEVQLPVGVTQKRDYATYTSQYKLEGTMITAERAFSSTVTELPYERLNDFMAFRRVLLADDRQQIAVHVAETNKGEALANAKTDELLESADAAYNSADYQAAIDLLEQVVKKEPAHKYAYNDLGRAYMATRQLSKAQAALEKAVEINPYSQYAYNNLARAYWLQRNYDLAEKNFRKQIEISPLDKFAHFNLGTMLLEQKKYADAEPEMEKAASIDRKNPLILTELGRAQINNGKVEKAQESFDKAVELAPGPGVWNNVAYQLAEHKLNLDRARIYAEQSVTMIITQLRNVRLDNLKTQDLGYVSFLGSAWDTLGWVYFQQGELEKAEKHLQAAWSLDQSSTEADHLGQLYEKKGDKARAIEMYARSQTTSRPDPDGRTHLNALVGASKGDAAIEAQRGKLSEERTFAIPEIKGDGTAEFFVLLAPGSKTEDVRFVSGSEKLKNMSDRLRATDFKPVFPDMSETRLVRRGILSCSGAAPIASKKPVPPKPAAEGPCAFVLITTDMVRSTN